MYSRSAGRGRGPCCTTSLEVRTGEIPPEVCSWTRQGTFTEPRLRAAFPAEEQCSNSLLNHVRANAIGQPDAVASGFFCFGRKPCGISPTRVLTLTALTRLLYGPRFFGTSGRYGGRYVHSSSGS